MNPVRDALYTYDQDEQQKIRAARPWKTDPRYFKHVRISAVALLKMVMHARSGGSIEIMGYMQGKISGDTIIIMDALRLPVEGTETRVNASAEAAEYIVKYLSNCRDNNQMENLVGWYHSHPGYGCWLSGIDVDTQHNHQLFDDPWIAIVIDPDRTISAGKVEIGAFRTYPEDYKPEMGLDDDGYQSIPLNKAEDFGAHASRYYQLEISHYKSTLDTSLLEELWNKYWVSTLTQSPLFSNRHYSTNQILDLSKKIHNGEKLAKNGMRPRHGDLEQAYVAIQRDNDKVAGEEQRGLLATEIKAKLFDGPKFASAAYTA